jgi:hypothetical protein
LWDDLSGQEIPAETPVTNNPSSFGFAPTPWTVNPAETNNCELMAFRPGFNSEGSILMGLPGTLDGTYGCMVQQNSGFNFVGGGNSFWTDGDFMTRQLTPDNFINFQAAGEYWFTMTIGNSTSSLDAQYVTFPASGAGGIGFADGTTTNADYVAVGVTGLNVYFGPTNASFPFGETNASKAVYISQGTLGQSGNTNSTVYNPLTDPNANPVDAPPNYAPPYNSEYTQTNFTGGPYHINAFGQQTVGNVMGDASSCWGTSKRLVMVPPPWMPNIIQPRVEIPGTTIWTPTAITSPGIAVTHLVLAARLRVCCCSRTVSFPSICMASGPAPTSAMSWVLIADALRWHL